MTVDIPNIHRLRCPHVIRDELREVIHVLLEGCKDHKVDHIYYLGSLWSGNQWTITI